jgi:hypothetical protein
MAKPENRKNYSFDRPGNYRIRVEGYLDESWSERLGGMRISNSAGENQESVATLTGLMVDQVALAGVLNTLYGMSKTLLSVEYLKDE